MKASTYKVLGTVAHHSEAVQRLHSPGDCAIVERGGVQRQLVMKCPDGCGEIISINLDQRSGPAWRLYHRHGLWSLFPSIDRSSGCESHFILWNGKVIWSESDWPQPDWLMERIDDVKGYLKGRGMTDYVEIADHIGLVPWHVLRICRMLVRQDLAEEGAKHLRGNFQLKPNQITNNTYS